MHNKEMLSELRATRPAQHKRHETFLVTDRVIKCAAFTLVALGNFASTEVNAQPQSDKVVSTTHNQSRSAATKTELEAVTFAPESDSVTLSFSHSVNAESALDTNSYDVQVNGKSIQTLFAHYKGTATVVLHLAAPVKAGDQVLVIYNFVDDNGASVAGSQIATLIKTTSEEIPQPIKDAVSQLPPFTLEQAARSYERIIARSGRSVGNSEALRQAFVKDLQATTPRITVRSSSLFNTTAAERWLILTNPYWAYLTYQAAVAARDEAARRRPGDQGQTLADAFRHAYWNVLLCKRINENWAYRYTTAHESETTNQLDKAMDLNNNAIGRRIFRENGFRSEASLSDYCYWFPNRLIWYPWQADNWSSLVYLR